MDKYKQFYIESLESEKFRGWLFIIIIIPLCILTWFFGSPELWNLKSKLIMTGVSLFLIYGYGIMPIQEANKELRKLK